MSVLPHALKTALEEHGKTEVLGASFVSGGMINKAACVQTASGPLFIKWNDSAPSDMLRQEANALDTISATHTLRVPKVIGFHDLGTLRQDEEDGSIRAPQYLILEYIDQSPPLDPASFAAQFGSLLAAMHLQKKDTPGFGHWEANFIGRLPQNNDWRPTWVEFYRDCRILPQMEISRGLGRLPIDRERLLMNICDRLAEILKGLDSHPSLLHGDLWSGNYLTAGDEPVVIDPAVYYGEREMEIAFMKLFGGFPSGVFEAYNEAYPLQPGYERRRALHQLYPLLVHLNHFGEPYGQDVDGVCRQYLD